MHEMQDDVRLVSNRFWSMSAFHLCAASLITKHSSRLKTEQTGESQIGVYDMELMETTGLFGDERCFTLVKLSDWFETSLISCIILSCIVSPF